MSCRTLIVEDDPQSREILAHLLKLLGYETDSAATLAEAERKLRWKTPDCLILDLMLPDGNGLSLLQKLRAADCPIRVAVTTAVHDHTMLNRMHALRPDAVFAKPINIDALTEWIASSGHSAA